MQEFAQKIQIFFIGLSPCIHLSQLVPLVGLSGNFVLMWRLTLVDDAKPGPLRLFKVGLSHQFYCPYGIF